MKIDLDKLEALEKAATPTGWQVLDMEPTQFYGNIIMDANRGNLMRTTSYGLMREDSRLVAAMRNALPAMIAELRAAREVVEMARLVTTERKISWYRRNVEAIQKYDEAVNAKD
jgi:hypothetical protein